MKWKKKVYEGPSPTKRKTNEEEEPSSDPKIKNIKEEKKKMFKKGLETWELKKLCHEEFLILEFIRSLG